jgi:hypothetical protein
MELDHTVVLFDEIDELVRKRDIEPDQFGRFLTTSMLPRVAELWKARRVIYFVATNHIEYFDRAITRSQRFDAILYIGPLDFSEKKVNLGRIFWETYGIKVQFDPALTQIAVEEALPRDKIAAIDIGTKEEQDRLKASPLEEQFALSKFALLRYDELDELAAWIAPSLGEDALITPEVLKSALINIRDSRARTLGEYHRFASDYKYQRFDVSKRRHG